MRPGRVEWIGVRPGRRVAAESLLSATLVAGHGVVGDRYESSRNGARQVTLIASEDIAAITAFLGLPETRRSFCVEISSPVASTWSR
jgi:hypothetical protein